MTMDTNVVEGVAMDNIDFVKRDPFFSKCENGCQNKKVENHCFKVKKGAAIDNLKKRGQLKFCFRPKKKRFSFVKQDAC
jgi:hypothetical protein